MDKQLLKDFIATVQADNYDYDVAITKFPELAGFDTQLLKDYVATAEKDNYDYEVINVKFPEFDLTAKTVKKRFFRGYFRRSAIGFRAGNSFFGWFRSNRSEGNS